MTNSQKILVTGASGFIGSFLIKELLKSGKNVRYLTRKTLKGKLPDNPLLDERIGDLTQPGTIKGISEQIDVVVHCAAKGHVSSMGNKAYRDFYSVNVEGSLNLARECLDKGVRKFILISSTAAMGLIKKEIANELSPCKPITPYQKSKYLAEKKLLELSEKNGLPLIILRPCMVYGPYPGGELLRWCRALKKRMFPKVGFGKNLSPIIHIDDLVTGIISAIEQGQISETYLLTSEKSYDMNLIIKTMCEELDIRYVPRIPVWIFLLSAYIIEITSTLFKFNTPVTSQNIRSMAADRLFDIGKAKNDLGFSPSYPIEKGLRETIRFYLKEHLV